MQADPPAPVVEVTLDVETLTLGELSRLEIESGSDVFTLLRAGKASRRLLILWLTDYRRSTPSVPRRSWRELSSLPALAALSSTSPSPSDGDSTTSSD